MFLKSAERSTECDCNEMFLPNGTSYAIFSDNCIIRTFLIVFRRHYRASSLSAFTPAAARQYLKSGGFPCSSAISRVFWSSPQCY